MSNLRTRLIHLANEHPELRGDLLPLLKTADGDFAGVTKALQEHAKIHASLKELGKSIYQMYAVQREIDPLSDLTEALKKAWTAVGRLEATNVPFYHIKSNLEKALRLSKTAGETK